MQVLIDARKGLPDPSTVEQERENWSRYTTRLCEPCPADMHVEDALFATSQRDVAVRIYRPAATRDLAPDKAPVIVYLHGGGFLKGDLDSSDAIAWGFAELSGAVVVSVDYRLTPEHPYPAAFNDAYSVTEYVAANAAALGIDPSRLAVAGDSAGGNLTAATCIAARDRNGPAIVAQALVYPMTGLAADSGSYIENAQAAGLTTAAMHRYRDLYLPTDPDTMDPYARPVVADDLSCLPPAWIHPAEIDPIRDDARVYASRLALAGTEVHYREAKNMIHGFMRARFTGSAARAEYEAICGFLRERLA
jgi:acetyl esterase